MRHIPLFKIRPELRHWQALLFLASAARRMRRARETKPVSTVTCPGMADL